MEERICERAEF